MAVTNRPDKIWSATLDDRYLCEVERTSASTGDLIIIDGTTYTELLREGVNLAYGAVFGPDVDDVGQWQNRAIEFVDGLGK